ncbi:MAG: RNA polymerase sigma factor [Chloroflexota bacterium]|nr:RNA polymerase sigma factor [Chloroflexota bacterium]
MADDDKLTECLARSLEASFDRLVLTYRDRLYALALRLCGSPRDAEEIAQDAFIRAYRALAGYAPERIAALRLRAWLYTITLNVARNRRRTHAVVETELEGLGAGREPAADERDEPEAAAQCAELRRELAAALAALPIRYRPAVVLRHVMGLGYRELAAVLRQPAGTAKSNVHRGTNLLRQALKEDRHGATNSDDPAA